MREALKGSQEGETRKPTCDGERRSREGIGKEFSGPWGLGRARKRLEALGRGDRRELRRIREGPERVRGDWREKAWERDWRVGREEELWWVWGRESRSRESQMGMVVGLGESPGRLGKGFGRMAQGLKEGF